jgi:ferredoxin-NADP reductase
MERRRPYIHTPMRLKITAINEEAPGVKTFTLDPDFPYQPGQFLTFTHNQLKDARRSYSLSSSPSTDRLPTITVKRVQNGLMSRYLIDQAKTGDTLTAEGFPTGLFTLPENLDSYKAVWLFAAGIGITPIFSLLKELLTNTSIPRIVLLYSNHAPEQAAFLRSLQILEQEHPHKFQQVNIWSNTPNLLRARISKESFPSFQNDYLTEAPRDVLAYICGPSSYMWMLQLLLQDAGVPPAHIRRELFELKREVPHRLPADKSPHRVGVTIAGKTRYFINSYPQSILSSARAAGIILPYSCDAGQCGSCTAICTRGKVWMSYNEVLTENDIKRGRVLTCTGHAIEGDLELSFNS